MILIRTFFSNDDAESMALITSVCRQGHISVARLEFSLWQETQDTQTLNDL